MSTKPKKSPLSQEPNCIVRYEPTNTQDSTLIEISLFAMKSDTIIEIMTTKEEGEVGTRHRVKKIVANQGFDHKLLVTLRTGGMIRIALEYGETKYHVQYHLKSRQQYNYTGEMKQLRSVTYYFSMVRDEIGLTSCIIEGEGLAETREAPNDIPANSLFSLD
jgi:hypothetical protein